MRRCRFCHESIADTSRVCEHCGKELLPAHVQLPLPVLEPEPMVKTGPLVVSIAQVSVVDVNMPFASMVGFMVKWSIAAIPAFLILFVLGAFMVAMLAAVGHSMR
jgi:hypothetical protein